MDKLIHDAAEAKARGMSYGQYMANIQSFPVAEVKQIKGDKNGKIIECCICGTKFRTNRHNKKTCSHECSEELNRRNNREIYLRKKYGEAMGKSIGV